MFNKICDAIRERRLLGFEYAGLRRVVHPYCHGLSSTGLETLRAIQIGGESKSGLGNVKGGKLWTVSKMSGLRVLEETFAGDDPHYMPHDSALSRIHCRIVRLRAAAPAKAHPRPRLGGIHDLLSLASYPRARSTLIFAGCKITPRGLTNDREQTMELEISNQSSDQEVVYELPESAILGPTVHES